MKKNSKFKILLVSVMFIALVSNIFLYMNNRKEYKEISYKLFLNYIEQGLVQEVELKDRPQLRGKLNNGKLFVTDNPRRENFKEYLLLNNVKVIEDKNVFPTQAITAILLLIGIGVLAYLTNKNYSKQAEK